MSTSPTWGPAEGPRKERNGRASRKRLPPRWMASASFPRSPSLSGVWPRGVRRRTVGGNLGAGFTVHPRTKRTVLELAFFSFLFKKLKISKIYGHFRKLRKWAPVAHGVGDKPPVAQATGDRDLSIIFYFSIFFFEQVPGGGRGAGGAVAPPTGDRGGLSPPPTGQQGRAALFKPPPLSPLILFSKILEKI